MTEPIRIALSTHQQARFAALRADIQRLTDRQNDLVTTLIAGTYDPAQFAKWAVELSETEIVCTPPQEEPAFDDVGVRRNGRVKARG